MIVVDYLQLMHGNSRESRTLEVGEVSQGLKNLAKELNVPVIALSQLSRAIEQRQGRRPQLSDLRESGSIEQDADIVIFIYRDEVYFKEEEWAAQFPDKEYPREIADIIIAKHRNGPTGRVELMFKKEQMRFYDIDKAHSSSVPADDE